MLEETQAKKDFGQREIFSWIVRRGFDLIKVAVALARGRVSRGALALPRRQERALVAN
jgi:hypothetical protein